VNDEPRANAGLIIIGILSTSFGEGDRGAFNVGKATLDSLWITSLPPLNSCCIPY